MKKIITLLLVTALLLTGCSFSEISNIDIQTEESKDTVISEQNTDDREIQEIVEFSSLNDPKLIQYIEETVYRDTIAELNSDNYLIENVSATYISKEYIDELTYNSQKNIYFGYTLSELEMQLGEEKYIFTCNEAGETIIAPYEEYDETYDQIMKNVAVGSGVILLCVTVSAVSSAVGVSAVSMIFAMSAKTAGEMALSSGIISGSIAAVTTGYQTKNVEETLKSTALAASDGFKWGAITGAVKGSGLKTSELCGEILKELDKNEAVTIQKESGYSIDIIKQLHSIDEYKIYKKANLYTKNIGGKMALVRDIDLKYESALPDGTIVTNLERMDSGYAPLDSSTEKAYQIYHIGQKSDGALAILTEEEYQENSLILNIKNKSSEIDEDAFSKVRRDFWKSFAESY